MAIIPGKWCEDCAEYDGEQTPAEHEWDARYLDSGGLFLCDKHASQRQEAWTEPDYDAVTLDELYQRAAREKRELDR